MKFDDLLLEDIYYDGNTVVFNYNTSDDKGISTKMGKNKFVPFLKTLSSVNLKDINVYDESNVEFDNLINSSNKEILKQSIKTPSVKQLGKIFDAGKSIFKNL